MVFSAKRNRKKRGKKADVCKMFVQLNSHLTSKNKKSLKQLISSLSYGAGDGTRTRNLLITNQLLCQLSYTSNGEQNGDPKGARTPDL